MCEPAGRRPVGALAVVVCAALVLGACARSDPAPVVFGSVHAPATTQKRAAPKPVARPNELARSRRDDVEEAQKGITSTTVATGETVYSMARRVGVAIRDLIDANELNPPYHLRAGQRLVVPSIRIHRVTKGDTLYQVSRRYGVDMYTIASVNLIAAPYTIRIGQRLRVPDRRSPVTATSTPQVASSDRAAAPTTTAKPGNAQRQPAKSQRVRSGPLRFAWPVRGRVISSFGAKPGGLHNDGINIAASAGAPIVAADTGIVAYAGNELRGFGNLLLLRHPGGWTTAYAHNKELLVKKGDRVARGDVIARAGATGRVGRPQLHFELRRGSDAVDPTKFLSPS